MEKYEILKAACLVIISFHVRGSQSRSLNVDESEHDISERKSKIEDWKTECTCFPFTVNGTPISKLVPSDDEQERLIVYFYKNKKSDELTSYTPNGKKQGTFPDLTFDIGDKIQTVTPDGVINLFDTVNDPERSDGVMEANAVPVSNVVTAKPDKIRSVSISYNQEQKTNSNPGTIVKIPSEEITVSLASPDKDNKIITNFNMNENLNLSEGNKSAHPIKDVVVESNQIINPILILNQSTPVIPNTSFSYILPGKEVETVTITSPDNYSENSTNNQNQKLESPLEQQNQLIKNLPNVYNYNSNFHVPIDASSGFAELVKYTLPGASVPPSNLNYVKSPTKQSNLVNIGYLSSKYENPIFNEWLRKQMVNIRSQRPYTANALNSHLLKLLLMKALYENGIHLSQDGELHDSNGHSLKMSSLKLRPIILGDPKDFEKLIAAKKCIIPYNLPYLEAVLVTLVYPPRILAIIPLNLRNDFISSRPRKIAPNLCGHPNCDTNNITSRSLLPEAEDSMNEFNGHIHKDDNDDENSYTNKEQSEEPLKDNGLVNLNKLELNNVYTYDTNAQVDTTNFPEDLRPKLKYNGQNNLLLTLTTNNPEGENIYVNDLISELSNKKCGHKHCQVNPSFRSGLSENDEPTSFSGTQDTREEIDEILSTNDEKSDGIIEETSIYKDREPANDDIPMKVSLESIPSSSDPEIYGAEFIPNSSNRQCVHCAINANFPSSQSEIEESTKNEYTLIDNQYNSEYLQTTEELSRELVNDEEPMYYSSDIAPEYINMSPYYDEENILQLTQNEPGLTTQPAFRGEIIYLDAEGNVEGRKSIADFDDSLDTPKKPDNEDDDMLNIRIVGGNPATSSGTPVNSRGRSGFDS